MKTQDWLILDANFLAWRAFYSSARGDPRAVLECVLYDASSLSDTFGASQVVFTFDCGPYHRSKLLPSYKQRRTQKQKDADSREQIQELRRQIDLMVSDHLPARGYQNVFSLAGYEADDLMASLVTAIPDNDRAILVSGDHDLYQLLSATCAVYHPVDKRFVTANSFRQDYRISPARWAEVKAIMGCPTDDVPGVFGVGEKLAVKYLRGELDPARKTHHKIDRFVKSPDYARNLELVRLPFTGMPPQSLRDSEVVKAES